MANPTSCAIPTQGTGDDGNVAGHYDQDNANTSLSHTAAFTYDAEHRLTAAAATGNSTYNLAYVYDRYGNMTCSQNQQTQGLCPQYGFSASTNQINNSGFSYDASGNMLSDNSHTYKYDAEGRLISVDNGSTASYVYNAEGERVEKDAGGSYTEYVFGLTQKPEGEYNRSAWTDTWVGFQGRHFAHFSNGDTYFVHTDRIGTTNIVTDWNTGTVIQDELHYPWGQVWTSAGSSIEERFASLQHRDGESNLDPTKYRMFSSDAGRWTTPDPADQLSASPTDPQSWNRYAYVLNNSMNFEDPYGLVNWPMVGKGIGGVVFGAAGILLSDGGLAFLGGGSAVVTGGLYIYAGLSSSPTAAKIASAYSNLTNPLGAATALTTGNLGYGEGGAAAWDQGSFLHGAGEAASTPLGTAGLYYNAISTGTEVGNAINNSPIGLENNMAVYMPPTEVDVSGGYAPDVPIETDDYSSYEISPNMGGGSELGGNYKLVDPFLGDENPDDW